SLTGSFRHTPLSDELFGPTTAERPNAVGTADEGVTPGEVGDAVAPGTRPDGSVEPTAADAPPPRPPDEPPPGGGDGGAGDDPGGRDDRTPDDDGGRGDPRLLSDRYPGETSSVLPLDPDVARAATYASGDVHHPGWDPPRSPADSYTPGPGEHGWRAENRPLHREPMKYQMQVTGLRPNANGWLPEYYRTGPDGNVISYDGMVVRDGVEVYLEVKNDWSELAFRPGSPEMQAKMKQFVEQAQDQVAALPPGAVLEWHVSDPHAAAAIRQEFADLDNGLPNVVVLYTPRS